MCASLLIGSEDLERDVEFEVVGEAPDKAPPPQTNQEEVNSITNGNKDSAQPSTSSKGQHRSGHDANAMTGGVNVQSCKNDNKGTPSGTAVDVFSTFILLQIQISEICQSKSRYINSVTFGEAKSSLKENRNLTVGNLTSLFKIASLFPLLCHYLYAFLHFDEILSFNYKLWFPLFESVLGGPLTSGCLSRSEAAKQPQTVTFPSP